MLLMHVQAPTSFDDLKRVSDVTTSTFREAAQLRGLLRNNDEADTCLGEAVAYQMPYIMRQLFATVLVHCTQVTQLSYRKSMK
mgnify:CR=1 FL=1